MTMSVLPPFSSKVHRGDGTFVTFLISPDEAGVRRHFDVLTQECHRLLRGSVAEHETVRAPRTNIGLAGKEGHSERPRCPPPLEQLGLGPGLEHDVRRAV